MKVIGIIMMGILFLVGFLACAKDMGLRMAVRIFGAVSGVAAWLILAAWFMKG